MVISSKDLSRGGIFLNTAQPPEPGTNVSVAVHLPEEQEVVAAVGRVIHSIPGSGMGVQFDRFDPGSLERLQAFLAGFSK